MKSNDDTYEPSWKCKLIREPAAQLGWREEAGTAQKVGVGVAIAALVLAVVVVVLLLVLL